MQKKQKLILASASPRRKELLNTLGIEFACEPADICEDPLPHEECTQYVRRLALEKALATAKNHTNRPSFVLGADTIVVLNQELLGKPKDKEQAIDYLTRLAGNTHQVFTGVCLLKNQKPCLHEVFESAVTIKPLTIKQIREYVETGEPMDKAGAYAAQGLGKEFIDSIKGSLNNVIGLPVELLRDKLKELNIL